MRTPSPKVTSIRSAVSAAFKKGRFSNRGSCRCIGVGRCTPPEVTLYAVKFERQLNDAELHYFSQLLLEMGDINDVRSLQSVSGSEPEEISDPLTVANGEPDPGLSCQSCGATVPLSELVSHSAICGKPFCPIHGHSTDHCSSECGNSSPGGIDLPPETD